MSDATTDVCRSEWTTLPVGRLMESRLGLNVEERGVHAGDPEITQPGVGCVILGLAEAEYESKFGSLARL